MLKNRVVYACLLIVIIVSIGAGILYNREFLWKSLFDEKTFSEKPKSVIEITDLSTAYEIILEYSTNDFVEGYPIDLSFLCWIGNTYGEVAITDIAYQLYEGNIDKELWYEMTGNTMHVLWLNYCKDFGYATYYLDNVHWMECANEEVVTIDLTGDINLADGWYTMQAVSTRVNGIYDCISEEVVNELQSADISVINNEFVFSDGGDRQTNKAYTFRAKTSNIKLLDVFGADLANLANNHTYDYRESGLMDTIATLENYGIATMGAGANLNEAKTIQYYVANGKKIAFVSATEIEKYYKFTKEATETEAGVLKTLNPEIYNQVIAEAQKNSDYVIASVHWGIEGSYRYNSSQYNLAKSFVEAGADAVIGGHPHRLQGVEYINDVPVCFSLGNFWFSTGTLYTTIAQIQINDEGELALRMIPCKQQDLTTTILSGEEATQFYKFMADISQNVAIDNNGFFYNTADGQNEHLQNEEYYRSEVGYDTYDGNKDLEGRTIDIVGNLQ